MPTLFAALFGYGVVTIMKRAQESGRSPEQCRRLARRRSAALIVIGLAHALLGFSGDVLGWYGLIGLLLVSRLQRSGRSLLRLALIWLVVASLLQGVVYADPTVREYRSHLWSYAIADPVRALLWRLVEWPMTPVGLLAVVSAVLVGAWAGHRRVLLEPEQHLPLLRRTAVLGIGAGALGGLGPALIAVQVWSPAYPVVLVLSALHIATGVFGGLGYGALLTLLARRLTTSGGDRTRRGLPLTVSALQATGQRSLSCYLAQSVVFVAVLPAWTLGVGAHLGPAGAAALAAAVWLLTAAFAGLLATRDRCGPAETLLHGLVGGGSATVRDRATIR